MKHLTTLLHNEHALSEPPLVAIAPALTNEEEMEKMEKEKDRETLVIRFNSAYFLCKKERPFSEFSSLLELQVRKLFYFYQVKLSSFISYAKYHFR